MAINKEKKIELVNDTVEKLKTAKAIYFTDYSGLKVEEMTELRKNLKKENIELKVIKNTLFLRALKEAKINVKDEFIKGHPIAAVISHEDEVAPAKIIYAFSKKNEQLEIVSGLIDGEEVADIMIKSLAQLPSREELYARLVGTLSAPIYGLVNVSAANIRNLTNVLNAYKEKIS